MSLEVLLIVVEACSGGVSLPGVFVAVAMEIVGENWRTTEEDSHTSAEERLEGGEGRREGRERGRWGRGMERRKRGRRRRNRKERRGKEWIKLMYIIII